MNLVAAVAGSVITVPADLRERRVAGLAAAFVVVALVALFFDTARSMAAIWQRSDTFGHGWLVVPIALWLVWRQREVVARAPLRPFWPALALVAGAGLAWLLGRLAGAAVVEHFALVAMIQTAVLAVLGPAAARAIAFPLVFLIFAVPFGEAFVPKLMDWTADFTVAALKLSGIPVYREGNFFVIPSGQWSVVEACSGLRYLIASLMVGALFAHLVYVTRWRKAAFVAASLVVPIVANWLRAYLIVMIGHLSGNELAAGVDHLIYGWLFFGVVMLLLFWVGARFRERGTVGVRRAAAESDPTPQGGPAAVAALVAVLLAGLWLPLSSRLGASDDGRARAIAPLAATNGWRPADASFFDWQPGFSGQRTVLRQAFERDGARVVVYVAYYAGQNASRSLITSANQLVASQEVRWREVARGTESVATRDGAVPVRSATIAAAAGRFHVLWTYWIDGHFTTSDAVGKLLLALTRLRGRADDAAAVFLFTEPSDRSDGAAVLRQFAADMAEPLARVLAAARDGVGR